MSTPTFIVGTGRCGSTLLSNLVRENPHIASISEFFSLASDLGARYPELFPEGALSAEAFWGLIGRGYPRSDLMIRYDVAMPEVIYPYKDPSARFNGSTGVPLISQATLPHLPGDPDALYDEVRAFVLGRPEQPIRAHYDDLFGWFTQRFDRRIWIERSGGIFNVMGPIWETFPDARFVHIVRDGRNTALSMNEHLGFRMFVLGQFLTDSLGVDPYYSEDREKLRRVPRQYRAFLPENFDAEAFRAFRFPLSMMGRLWSGQIEQGLKVLDQVPGDRLLTLRFEDLTAEPRAELSRLAAFLGEGFDVPAWLDTASKVVRRASSQWQTLDAKDQATLNAACQSGFDALAARGVVYDR